MVRRQLDGLLVQRGQEGFGEVHFGHDRSLESTVQSIVFCEISQVCGSSEAFLSDMLYVGVGVGGQKPGCAAGSGNDDGASQREIHMIGRA
jgi:hypothetical protein